MVWPYIYSLNPFGVDFFVWCELRVQWYFSACGYLIFLPEFLEYSYLFHHCVFSAPIQRSVEYSVEDFTSELCILFHGSICFVPDIQFWQLYKYILKSGSSATSNFVLCQDCFGVEILLFFMNFKFFYFCKKCNWDFDSRTWCGMNTLTVLILPVHELEIFFPICLCLNSFISI